MNSTIVDAESGGCIVFSQAEDPTDAVGTNTMVPLMEQKIYIQHRPIPSSAHSNFLVKHFFESAIF